ncbi:tetratricopeptide repeat protein [Chondromyces crocatus]|uniref:tetratricopeptide repeat protein n=1 Tax=Chondromyces crocatus TaxID=52 RepID=UPI003CCB8D52
MLLTSACASTPSAETVASPREVPARAVVEVAPIVVSPYTDEQLTALFEEARVLLLGGKPQEAARQFELLARLAPLGTVAPPSVLNAGIAHDELGDRETAADRYREVLRSFPEHEVTRAALLRLVRAAAYMERWTEVIECAERLIGHRASSVLEMVEARGARALGLVELDRVDEAAREVGRARDLIEEHRLGEAGKPPLELAQVHFALGEVRRRRSEAIVFQPFPRDFADALERRCQGLLDAQSAYSETMRSLDAHWSAMAGYRVAQLYRDLHRDLMQITLTDAQASPAKRELFEGAKRLRYRVLLEKGKKMMDGTVKMAERTGESSGWARRAREAQQELERALAEEKEALARLPYTEAELNAALATLKRP